MLNQCRGSLQHDVIGGPFTLIFGEATVVELNGRRACLLTLLCTLCD